MSSKLRPENGRESFPYTPRCAKAIHNRETKLPRHFTCAIKKWEYQYGHSTNEVNGKLAVLSIIYFNGMKQNNIKYTISN